MENSMTKIGTLALALGILTIALSMTVAPLMGREVTLSIPEQAMPNNDPTLSEDEMLALWGAGSVTMYQVDVFVTGSHATAHPTSNAAMRCLSQNGNVAAFSEFGSWNLHLLCWDRTTKTLYDVIVARINRFVKQSENFNTHLKTAYAPLTESGYVPETVQSAVSSGDKMGQISWYLEHLKDTIGGKIVGLEFAPGEIFFMPK